MLEEVTPVAMPGSRPTPAPSSSPASTAVPAKTPERNESDEEISSYMSQLLKRTGQSPSPTAAVPLNPPVSQVANTWADQPVDNSSDPLATEEIPWTEAQYIPKKLAPEREADLRAFRQLANASARGALNSFQQKEQRKHCTTSGLVSVCCFVAAVPLFLWGSQFGDQWGLGAVAALAVGGLFGYRYQKSRGRLTK